MVDKETEKTSRTWRLRVKGCSISTIKKITGFIYKTKPKEAVKERGMLFDKTFEFPCTYEEIEAVRHFLTYDVPAQRFGHISFIPQPLENERN